MYYVESVKAPTYQDIFSVVIAHSKWNLQHHGGHAPLHLIENIMLCPLPKLTPIPPTRKVTWILGSTEAAPELAGRGKVPLPAFNRVVELFAVTADTLQYETLTREISSLGLRPFHSPLVAVLLLLAQG